MFTYLHYLQEHRRCRHHHAARLRATLKPSLAKLQIECTASFLSLSLSTQPVNNQIVAKATTNRDELAELV